MDQKSNSDSHVSRQINSITWAVVFVWVGCVFLLRNFGWLDMIKLPGIFTPGFDGLDAWPLAMVGSGVIFLAAAIIMVISPDSHQSFTGPMILAAIALGIGLGSWFSWSVTGPLVIIAIGVSILLKNLLKRDI